MVRLLAMKDMEDGKAFVVSDYVDEFEAYAIHADAGPRHLRCTSGRPRRRRIREDAPALGHRHGGTPGST